MRLTVVRREHASIVYRLMGFVKWLTYQAAISQTFALGRPFAPLDKRDRDARVGHAAIVLIEEHNSLHALASRRAR